MIESIFSTDKFEPSVVRAIQWNEIFSENDSIHLHQLSQRLLDSGRLLREKKSAHPDTIRTIEAVGHAASMCFRDDQHGDLELYPFIVLEEGRSAAISDFSEESARLLATVAPHLPDLQLRARVSDIAWEVDRSLHASGRLAIVSYVQLSIKISSSKDNARLPDFSVCDESLKRALTLSGRHPDRSFYPYLKNRLLTVIDLQLDTATRVPLDVLELLVTSFRPQDNEIDSLIDRLEEYSSAIEGEDADLSVRILRHCTHYHVRSTNKERLRANLVKEAALLESIADSMSTNDISSVLRAESKLREAIGALERVSGTKEERSRIQLKIGDLRNQSKDKWQSVTHEMDLRDISRWSTQLVSGLAPDNALIKLAFIQQFPEKEKVLEEARKNIRENVFSNMMGAQVYGSSGNLEGYVDGILPGDIPTEEQVEIRAIRDFSMRIALVVHGVILPALEVVRREHRYRRADFFHLLGGNRFFRHDRHQLVTLGLYHGYRGDFVSACHILIPQIEYSCRALLREAGESTTIRKEGRELEIDLNKMLYEPNSTTLESLLNPDLVFTMKALLVHRFGGNFRNDLLHGNHSDSVFDSYYACYTWWLCLNLALVPRFYERVQANETSDVA